MEISLGYPLKGWFIYRYLEKTRWFSIFFEATGLLVAKGFSVAGD